MEERKDRPDQSHSKLNQISAEEKISTENEKVEEEKKEEEDTERNAQSK